MPIRYKMNVLGELKKKGYSSYRLRKERIIGEFQVQQLRAGEIVSATILDRLCALLDCQPGDLLEYAPEDSGKPE